MKTKFPMLFLFILFGYGCCSAQFKWKIEKFINENFIKGTVNYEYYPDSTLKCKEIVKIYDNKWVLDDVWMIVRKKETYYLGGGYAKEKIKEIYGIWWDIHYPKTIKFKRYNKDGRLMQRYVKKVNEDYKEGERILRSFNIIVNPRFKANKKYYSCSGSNAIAI